VFSRTRTRVGAFTEARRARLHSITKLARTLNRGSDENRRMSETELIERLGAAELNELVKISLSDGTTFEGPASPIDYVPEDSLRLEVRPEGGTTERYELSAEYDDGWSQLTVRHTDANEKGSGWEELGTVEDVEVRGDEP